MDEWREGGREGGSEGGREGGGERERDRLRFELGLFKGIGIQNVQNSYLILYSSKVQNQLRNLKMSWIHPYIHSPSFPSQQPDLVYLLHPPLLREAFLLAKADIPDDSPPACSAAQQRSSFAQELRTQPWDFPIDQVYKMSIRFP